jgi:hypothetical protein|tara:strand:- start:1115 stop:1414 length:300 start_codon:yes stop_codon:yes gene_type:complete
MKITRRQLRRIIKEEKARLLSEQDRAWEFSDDDELRELGMAIDRLLEDADDVHGLMSGQGYNHGELVALATDTRTILQYVQELAKRYNSKLDDIERFRK